MKKYSVLKDFAKSANYHEGYKIWNSKYPSFTPARLGLQIAILCHENEIDLPSENVSYISKENVEKDFAFYDEKTRKKLANELFEIFLQKYLGIPSFNYFDAILWLSNKFSLNCFILPRFDGFDNAQIGFHWSIYNKETSYGDISNKGDDSCLTYSEAAASMIQEALDIIEDKNMINK